MHDTVREAVPPSRQELLALLEHLPVAVYFVDLAERWCYLNGETAAVIGRDASELLGRTLAETFPDDVRAVLAEHNRQVAASGEVLRLEEVVTDVRTGRPHDFVTLKLPVYDDDGCVTGIGGVSMDVTRQDRDRRSLDVLRELFGRAVGQAPDGVLLARCDRHGGCSILQRNTVLSRALGREDEPMAGDVRRLVCAEDAARFERLLLTAAEGGRSHGSIYLRHRDGHRVAAEVQLDRVEDLDDGDLLLMRADLQPAAPAPLPLIPDRLVLHAQPIAALQRPAESGRRFELLLRVRDEAGGLHPPAEFLDRAEEDGRITFVDGWVAEQAVRLLHRDHAAGGRLELACNVSATTLQDPRFADLLKALLEGRPVRPGSLTLELTETAALRSVATVRGACERARALGCRIAIDDFGAGFAGFLHLKQLELDVVKLDRELIGDISRGVAERRLVEAIVALAAALDVELIAEGVEDDTTARALIELGVAAAQGLYFGGPEPLPGA